MKKIEKLITAPWFDRLIGIGMGLYWTSAAISLLRFHPPRIELFIQCALFFVLGGTMFVRRPPTRVSTDIWIWLLIFLITFGEPFMFVYTPVGYPLVPRFISLGIFILGFLIVTCARLTLGRNIGLVPARRELITSGIYRIVRHPIYLGVTICSFDFVLQKFSFTLLIFFFVVVAARIFKLTVEERFLAKDADYREYMARVRWRLIPFLY